MPTIPFTSLPHHARLWVFAASDPVTGERAGELLRAVDDWLSQWQAHGEPLTCARDWRDDRFLAIGVDQSTSGASGCSIDALFRILQEFQEGLGTTLLGSGRIFYRNREGGIEVANRQSFRARASIGEVDAETIVFDTSVTTAEAWRAGFARRAAESWHRELLPTAVNQRSG